jgi:hypothetical protein
MRNKDEIFDLLKIIDDNKTVFEDNNNTEYPSDVKATLQWILAKISNGQEQSSIENELKKLNEKLDEKLDELFDEGMSDTYIPLINHMNQEFNDHFKGREDEYCLATVTEVFE